MHHRSGTMIAWLAFASLLLVPVDVRAARVKPVNLTIGYLPTITGDQRDKQGLSISGALTFALEQIKEKSLLPDGVELTLQLNDTRSDLLFTTKALTEMMCRQVVAVFGPENTCNVEATITSAWNRLMISHVKKNFARLLRLKLLNEKLFLNRTAPTTRSRTRKSSRRSYERTRRRPR